MHYNRKTNGKDEKLDKQIEVGTRKSNSEGQFVQYVVH